MVRLLPLLLLFGCSATPGIDYGGTTLPLVDMHLHTGEWEDIPSGTRAFLAERFPFPLNLDAKATASAVLSGDGVLAELDKAGAQQGVLFAVYAPRSVGVTTNATVIEHISADPTRLWGLASLRVDNWRVDRIEQLAALEAALEHPNMIGIKIAHAHQHFRMDDADYYGIYEVAAAHNAPVYLHTGPSPFPGTSQDAPYTDPAFLEEAIARYPDTTFILGHLGFDFINKVHGTLETCISLAKTYDNVYLEPSAFGSTGGDPDQIHLPHALARIRDEGLTDRVIYGSDGPQSPGFVNTYAERTVYALQDAGWSDGEAADALSGNFAAVFGVPQAVVE
jgi:uncharacterized protein